MMKYHSNKIMLDGMGDSSYNKFKTIDSRTSVAQLEDPKKLTFSPNINCLSNS